MGRSAVTLGSRLDGVLGARTSSALEKAFGLRTVADLLGHYPRRMLERGELTDLAELRIDEDATVMANVLKTEVRGFGKSVRLEVIIGDESGSRMQLVFFGARNTWRERELHPGVLGLFSGKVGEFRGQRQLAHPDYRILRSDTLVDDALAGHEADEFAGALIPLYPATKDVRSWVIANSVRLVLTQMEPLADPLPGALRQRHRLLDYDTALRAMHQPEATAQWFAARHRIKWDEAFGVQLVLAQRRRAAAANPAIARPLRETSSGGGLLADFDAQLPFELTAGQRAVGEQLSAELAQPHPMHRLLQGEVGSGKTIVALRAMLQVIDAGGQAALLAPTEVLAAQHARTLETMLGPLAHAGQLGGAEHGTRIALLTGSLPAAARNAALLDAASGAAGIVVGTHALIQEQVQFAELGLVVVDEQHRFGVEQRDALRSKATQPPHLLVMTATPIPRTVAMTVFGDLETSTLTELPAGRAPIATTVVPARDRPDWLNRVWQRIAEEVAAGRQAYVVCPRIGEGITDADEEPTGDDPSEDRAEEKAPRSAAVLDVLVMLRDGPLAGLRLQPLHGRLAPDEKERTMLDFAAGAVDVLVATTVVEVGVDVPNATVMAVLDAERFGVSQLHQLRGRIGRGGHPGICLLVTDQPAGSPSRERLDAVASTTDGFELARLDVEQRREGDVLGVAQSGRRSQFALLSLLKDEDLIVAAQQEATDLIGDDPELAAYPLLAAQTIVLASDDRAEYLDKG
jgi:ATP-dependent DNA helicase RecG